MRFPLLEKQTVLGKISDPRIPVFIKTPSGLVLYRFLLDTGADFTMLPLSLAKVIGLDPSSLSQTRLYGIEGKGVTALVAKVTLKIGQWPFEVTALLSTQKGTPPILGRQGLFDKFNIHFDNRRKVIRLSPLATRPSFKI